MKTVASTISGFVVGAAFALTLPGAAAQQSGDAIAKMSIWSGVYNEAQNKRGEEIHLSACASCHGPKLNGAGQADMPQSPAIARQTFLRKWEGQTVAALFTYVRTKMPPDSPGTLTDQQAIDAIAHMMAVSDIPAGANELRPDAISLANIVIEEKARSDAAAKPSPQKPSPQKPSPQPN